MLNVLLRNPWFQYHQDRIITIIVIKQICRILIQRKFIFCILFFEVDGVPPDITCPDNIVQQVTSGTENGATISWPMPTATDNSGNQPVVTLSSDPQQVPNSLFIFGMHTISYTARDMANNVAMCSFTITIGKFVSSS